MKRTESSKYEEWVRAHHQAVYRTALRIVRQESDALDVTQKVYLQVLEREAQVAKAEDVGRLLRWMAVKVALTHEREAHSRKAREEQTAMRTERRAEEAAEAGLERAEERQVLGKALNGLADELRLPLVLRFQEGLTYAELAEVYVCSEPTARERVLRGVEQLKRELARLGFAGMIAGAGFTAGRQVGETDAEGMAAGWKEALARLDTPGRLPNGLEPKLLALKAAPAAVSALALPLGVAAAVLSIVAGALIVNRERDAAEGSSALARMETPASLVEAVQPEDSGRPDAPPGTAGVEEAGRQPVRLVTGAASPAPGEPAVSTPAFVRGRLQDERGAALQGLLVVAEWDRPRLKGDWFMAEAQARSAANGAFEIELSLPADAAAGRDYRVRVVDLAELAVPLPSVRVKPAETRDLGVLTLRGLVAEDQEPFVLEVLLLDESGQPLDGLIAALDHVTRDSGGVEKHALEAQAQSDASGRVELAGERLGTKRLRVDARASGFVALRRELRIASGGRLALSCVLQRGLEIEGRVLVPQGVRLPLPILYAFQQREQPWLETDIEADGSFLMRGLAAGAYTLALQDWSQTVSPFELAGVEAGTRGLALELKRADDARDIGLHKAEIHGRTRAAATGDPAPLPDSHAWIYTLPEVDAAELAADVLPNVVRWPVQTAFMGQTREGGQHAEPVAPEPRAEFHLTGLDAGRYVAVVEASGYARALSGPVSLSAGQIASSVDVLLRLGATIEGVVRASDGAPVAGAWVLLTGSGQRSQQRVRECDEQVKEAAGKSPPRFPGSVRTDGEGRFRFGRIDPTLAWRLVTMHATWEPVEGAAPALGDGETAPGVELRFERPR